MDNPENSLEQVTVLTLPTKSSFCCVFGSDQDSLQHPVKSISLMYRDSWDLKAYKINPKPKIFREHTEEKILFF